MAGFRKFLFLAHLTLGVAAGLVILMMSVTGVLLTYERQIVAYLEPLASVPTAEGLEMALSRQPSPPANITLNRQGLVQPAQPGGARTFFRKVTEIHRWFAASGESRTAARAVTGAANLAFLVLVVSGLYLWFPRRWTWPTFRAVLWFRDGLSGKARNFNWHNTAGFWACVPLFVIALSGVVMSYPWANNLVYSMNGVKPPVAGKGKAKGAERVRTVSTKNLDELVARAQRQNPDWTSISIQLPASDEAPVTFNIDSGNGGQPQKRSTLMLSRAGDIVKYETFAAQDSGRQARSWMRFAHTGEYYGVAGQTVAGIASTAGAVLVWTGLALAYRRLRQMLRQRRPAVISETLQEIAP